jgi:LPXTG-site transpeptidase (sortase) family protein
VIAIGLAFAIYGLYGLTTLLFRQADPAFPGSFNRSPINQAPLVGQAVLPSPDRVQPSHTSTPLQHGNVPVQPTLPPAETTPLPQVVAWLLDQSLDEALHDEARILAPEDPIRLVISAIDLDAPIIPSDIKTIEVNGQAYQQWLVPNQYAAGWHSGSARLGELGNLVLNGHHNVYDEVFRDLEKLNVGELILVYSDVHVFTYQITNKMILPEKYQEMDTRMENAQWVLPSQDERLTLITCWPYESNTHRLIVVARPLFHQQITSPME